MSNDSSQAPSNTAWWITSLAISVVCCAVLFVVFAGYLFGFREKLLVVETKLSMMEQRNAQLVMEIDNISRRAHVQQIQIIPPTLSSSPQNTQGPQTTEQNAAPPIVGIAPKSQPRAGEQTQPSETSGTQVPVQPPVLSPSNAQGGATAGTSTPTTPSIK